MTEDTPRPLQEIIPETPDWFVAIVDKLLAKDPADRFQTAQELAGPLGDEHLGDRPGLAHFQDCKKLKILWFAGTKLTDTGLAYFKEYQDLTEVYLDKTNFNNSWLNHLMNSKNLKTLSITKTSASDNGLPLLKEFKHLKFLYLQETEMTAAGIDGLKKSLPECRIEWNKGEIEPAATKSLDWRTHRPDSTT